MQHVRLVFGRIDTGKQHRVTVALANAGVVAGDEDVAAERGDAIEQHPEPDSPIAFDARVRGASLQVPGDESIDDLRGELLHLIEHVVRHTEPGGDAAGVFGVGDRAASRLAGVRLHRPIA